MRGRDAGDEAELSSAAMTPPSVTIRPAAPADVPALGRLGALLVSLHHQLDPARFIAPGPHTERGYGGFLGRELAREGALVLVAEQAGAVVGYAYAGLEGADWMMLRGPAGVIYDLVVDPGHQRQGVGRRLLAETMGALTALGAPRLVLFTAAHNERAQRVFAAAGFRATMAEMTLEPPS